MNSLLMSRQLRCANFSNDIIPYNEVTQHYNDVIMGAIGSQITSLTIVYSTVYSGADQRKHESSAALAFVRGIHRSPMNGPVTRKMCPFDDVMMKSIVLSNLELR